MSAVTSLCAPRRLPTWLFTRCLFPLLGRYIPAWVVLGIFIDRASKGTQHATNYTQGTNWSLVGAWFLFLATVFLSLFKFPVRVGGTCEVDDTHLSAGAHAVIAWLLQAFIMAYKRAHYTAEELQSSRLPDKACSVQPQRNGKLCVGCKCRCTVGRITLAVSEPMERRQGSGWG